MRSLLTLLILSTPLLAQRKTEPWVTPALPDGKTAVTDTSDAFLKPTGTLKEGVKIAKTAPTIDFLYYPEQNYPGNPWSHRSDGIVVGDKYYSSSNDHLAPRGTALLWEYDAITKQFRQLCDTTRFLESVKAFPDSMNYRPGEMQSRIDLGRDGWLYYATDRGSPTVTHDSCGLAATVWKLPMRATCSALLTPSPISGRTICSLARTSSSVSSSTRATNSGARQRITLMFASAFRV